MPVAPTIVKNTKRIFQKGGHLTDSVGCMQTAGRHLLSVQAVAPVRRLSDRALLQKLHWNPTHQTCLEGISSPSPRAGSFSLCRGGGWGGGVGSCMSRVILLQNFNFCSRNKPKLNPQFDLFINHLSRTSLVPYFHFLFVLGLHLLTHEKNIQAERWKTHNSLLFFKTGQESHIQKRYQEWDSEPPLWEKH